MQIRELSKPITANQLNESLAKTFGYKLNLEQFTEAQLEDARNKLRTKISQFEVSESYDSVNESPEYQKTRMFLDVVNQALAERADQVKPDFADIDSDDDEKESMKQAAADKKAKLKKKVHADKLKTKAMEHSVPESWINSALSRIELDEADSDELAAELTTRYDLSENQANYIVYLAEGEEEKAHNIMSTKDMVDRVTGWLDDVSEMRAEQLLQLLDSIRAELGAQTAEQYTQAVRPALDELYQHLEQTRSHLHSALSVVSGGDQGEMMGAEQPGADMGAGMPQPGMPGEEGGEGGEETTPPMGREMRETAAYSRRLGQMLASKKK